MLGDDDRDFGQTDTLGGLNTGVAGNDDAGGIDQHGQREPKLLDRGRQFDELLLGMFAGVVSVSCERGGRAILDRTEAVGYVAQGTGAGIEF